ERRARQRRSAEAEPMSQTDDPKAALSRYWDDLAPRWSTRPRPVDLDSFVAQLGCTPPALVLDAGCGDGPLSLPLGRAGYCVHGVDLSGEMITFAQRAARDQ